MASLSRSGFQAQVVDNPTFGVYVEQEPHLRELIESYMASKFQTVLEILERFSVRTIFSLRHHVHAHSDSTDAPLHGYTPLPACAPPNGKDKESCCGAVFPAIFVYPTRPNESGIWMDGRRS